jgi:hypothetical protein
MESQRDGSIKYSITYPLDKYTVDLESAYYIENNTELSVNVKRLMVGWNFSTTHYVNFDGSITFIFNFYNRSNDTYSLISLTAYKIQ